MTVAEPLHLALDAQRAVRQLAGGDLDELFALQLANQEHLAPWMPWAEHLDRDQSAAFLAQAEQQAARDDGVHCAVTQDGRIVGVAGFHYVNRADLATSIGYWLAAGAQGRGTMTLALAVLVEHAFEAWGMHRVELQAAVGNVRSRAVAERLGFVHEGRLRQAERFAARYEDLDVFSLLEPEWRLRSERTAAPGP
jgi:ribosomal-protein-serine acetyltransferase